MKRLSPFIVIVITVLAFLPVLGRGGGLIVVINQGSSSSPTSSPTSSPATTLSQNIANLVVDVQGTGSVIPSLCAAGGTDPCTTQGSATLSAAGNGTTDDTAAFTTALAAGDVSVPGNKTYLINGNITVPSFRTLQCQPGAILKTTNNSATVSEILNFSSTSYSYVLGCVFQGPYTSGASNPNYAIFMSGGADNTLVGNTFMGFPSTAAVVMTGGTNIDVAVLNDFERNYDLGIETINASDTMMALNRVVDSSIGNILSVSTDTNAHNFLGWNYQKKVSGNGLGNVFLAGNGTTASPGFTANYGTDAVVMNVMRSIDNFYSTLSGAGLTAATYQNNQVSPTTPAVIAQSGGPQIIQDFNTTISFLMDQAVPSPLLNSNACGVFTKGASCGGHTVAGDGATDETAALQYWLTQGDVLVTGAFTYAINPPSGGVAIHMPAYRTLQCAQGPIIQNIATNTYGTIFDVGKINTTAGHNTIIGCNFYGKDWTPGNPAAFPFTSSANFLDIVDMGPNGPSTGVGPADILLFGNNLYGIAGYGFDVYTPCGTSNTGPCNGNSPFVAAPNHVAELFNRGNHASQCILCASGGGQIHIGFNYLTDTRGYDIESDPGVLQTTQAFMDHNQLDAQYLSQTNGGEALPPYINCGNAAGADYSNNYCINNIVNGKDAGGRGLYLYESNTSASNLHAHYMQNFILNGAVKG